LSLLTSDFYSAGARVVFFGGFSATAALSFAASCTCVVTGLVLYYTAPETSAGDDAFQRLPDLGSGDPGAHSSSASAVMAATLGSPGSARSGSDRASMLKAAASSVQASSPPSELSTRMPRSPHLYVGGAPRVIKGEARRSFSSRSLPEGKVLEADPHEAKGARQDVQIDKSDCMIEDRSSKDP
jgi:hypothetical protein